MRKCGVNYKEAKTILTEARKNLGLSEQSKTWFDELEAECTRVNEVAKSEPSPKTIAALIQCSKDTAKKQQRCVTSGSSVQTSSTSSTQSSDSQTDLRKLPTSVQTADLSSTMKSVRRSKSVGARTGRTSQRVANTAVTEGTGCSTAVPERSMSRARSTRRASRIEENEDDLDTNRSNPQRRNPSTATEVTEGLDGIALYASRARSRARSRTRRPFSDDSSCDSGSVTAKSRTKTSDENVEGTDATTRRSKSKARPLPEEKDGGLDLGSPLSTRSRSKTRRSVTSDGPQVANTASHSTRSRPTTRRPAPEEASSDVAVRSRANSRSRAKTDTAAGEGNIIDGGGISHTRSSVKPAELEGRTKTSNIRSKSKARKSVVSDDFEFPDNGKSRVKTVTRRLVSAEELESACLADPSIRDAIAKSSGVSCRLGLSRAPGQSKCGAADVDEVPEVPVPTSNSTAKITGNATVVVRKRAKTPARRSALRSAKDDAETVSLHFANFDNGATELTDDMNIPDQTSMPPDANMMVNPVRKRASAVIPSGSTSIYNSPTRSHSPTQSPIKSPSILRGGKAQVKNLAPAPMLIEFDDVIFPEATKAGNKERSAAPMENFDDDFYKNSSFTQEPLESTDFAKSFFVMKPEWDEGTPCMSHNEASSPKIVEKEKDSHCLFRTTQSFDSVDPAFPECGQNRTTRGRNRTFDKQESKRSASAPRRPQRQQSSDRCLF